MTLVSLRIRANIVVSLGALGRENKQKNPGKQKLHSLEKVVLQFLNLVRRKQKRGVRGFSKERSYTADETSFFVAESRR